MPNSATPAEAAVVILSVFKAHNTGSGEVLLLGALKKAYFEKLGENDGFLEGLKFAENGGWVEFASQTMLRLTATGHSKIQT